VFATLLRLRFDATELATVATASLACLALAAVISFLVLRLTRLPLRIYLSVLIFPNSGNMGMPLCLFAFGDAGLGLAVASFAVLATAQFTIGPAIAAGGLDLRQVARTPLLYAVALALLLQALGAELPRWAANTTTLMGNCAVPLMLLSLGVALSRLRAAGIRRALAMSAMRLGLGFAVGLVVATGPRGRDSGSGDSRERHASSGFQLSLGSALQYCAGSGRRPGAGLDGAVLRHSALIAAVPNVRAQPDGANSANSQVRASPETLTSRGLALSTIRS